LEVPFYRVGTKFWKVRTAIQEYRFQCELFVNVLNSPQWQRGERTIRTPDTVTLITIVTCLLTVIKAHGIRFIKHTCAFSKCFCFNIRLDDAMCNVKTVRVTVTFNSSLLILHVYSVVCKPRCASKRT